MTTEIKLTDYTNSPEVIKEFFNKSVTGDIRTAMKAFRDELNNREFHGSILSGFAGDARNIIEDCGFTLDSEINGKVIDCINAKFI